MSDISESSLLNEIQRLKRENEYLKESNLRLNDRLEANWRYVDSASDRIDLYLNRALKAEKTIKKQAEEFSWRLNRMRTLLAKAESANPTKLWVSGPVLGSHGHYTVSASTEAKEVSARVYLKPYEKKLRNRYKSRNRKKDLQEKIAFKESVNLDYEREQFLDYLAELIGYHQCNLTDRESPYFSLFS